MEQAYKEDYFYKEGGAPTESFRYCNYHLNQNGDDYDQFALVTNALYPYIRLAKKRGNSHYPCGMMKSPGIDGWYAKLTNEERDLQCPKIAWGFAAEFLANLRYDYDQKDYVSIIDMRKLIDMFYEICLTRYLDSHNSLKYYDLTDRQKELDFLSEHESEIRLLWEKSEPLKDYPQLYEYAQRAEQAYERYLDIRKRDLKKNQDKEMISQCSESSMDKRTVIQNGDKSIYIENHTGPIIINPSQACMQDVGRDEAHFADIERRIIEMLDSALATIDVCVAWFTNHNLLDKLLEKSKQGVAVRVITFNDGVNKNHGVDLSQLEHKAYRGERGGILHDKFCVIDNIHVICGSYNWTMNAEKKNDENAEFHHNKHEFASQFTRRFNEIWRRDKETGGTAHDEDMAGVRPSCCELPGAAG